MSGVAMSGVTMPGTAMVGSTMVGSTMVGTAMAGTMVNTMAGTAMTGTVLPGTTMTGNTMTGNTMPGTTMPGTAMPGTTMSSTTIPGTTMPGTAISSTTIPGTTMSGTTMPITTMPGTMPGMAMKVGQPTTIVSSNASMPGPPMKVGPQPSSTFKKPEPLPPTPFKIEPETTLDDWKKWQISFRYYAHAVNLDQKSHDVQISTFKSVVGPDALEIYNTFSILDITDVESVMRKFDDHFKPKYNVTLERFKLYKLSQRSGQKFDDYLSDLTNQVDKCEFDSVRDDIILYKIVGGIDSDEVRNALLADEHLKYEKAVQICRASSTMHFMSGKDSSRKGKENAKKAKVEAPKEPAKKVINLDTALEVVLTEGSKKRSTANLRRGPPRKEKTAKILKMPKTTTTRQDSAKSKALEEIPAEAVSKEEKVDEANDVEAAGPSKEEFLKEYVQLKPTENDAKDASQEKDASDDGGDSDWRGDDDDHHYDDDDDDEDYDPGVESSGGVGVKEREGNEETGEKKVKRKRRVMKKKRKSGDKPAKVKNLPCDKCDKIFATELGLEKHRSSHIPQDKNVICFYCGKKYKKDFLRRHMTGLHHEIIGCPPPKMFSCDICPFTTRFPENLQRHKFQHSGEKPLACDHCDYRCIRPRLMKAHVAKVHTGERPYSCSVCKRGFLHSDAMKRHMYVHLTPEEKLTVKRPVIDKKKYRDRHRSTCETCGKVFNSRAALTTHSMRHTGEKPFACHACEFRTVTNTLLNSHILSKHSDEKPFVCSVCGYACKQTTALKHHMLTHTAEKPHACEVCGRKFAQLSHVKRHRMTHTGEKPHVCEICGHRWTTKENLKAHMKVHQKQSGDPSQYTPPRKRQKKVITVVTATQSEESGSHSEPAAAADAIIQWSEQVSAINTIDYTPSLETPPPFHPTYPVHQGNPRPSDCRYFQQRQQWPPAINNMNNQNNQGYR